MIGETPGGNSLRNLHRHEGAALAPVFGFILVFFAWGIMTILNTGQVAYDKVRLQNTADAVALAHGDQMARDLNVMSMNNVALSQMIVVSAVSFTLMEVIGIFTAKSIVAEATIMKRGATDCAGTGPFYPACIAVYAALTLPIVKGQLQAANVIRRYRPDRGLSTSQRLIRAFNQMNDHLARTFPARSGVIMKDLVELNGAETAFIYPPCETDGDSDCHGNVGEGADLPVDRSTFNAFIAYRELCDASERGALGQHRVDYKVHGYPPGKGPYTAGGSGSRPHVRDHVNREAEMADILPFYDSYTSFSHYFSLIDLYFQFPDFARYDDKQTASDNDFITKMNDNWRLICGSTGGGASILSGLTGQLVQLPKPYWLEARPPAAAVSPALGLIGFDHKKLAFLAIVAQERGARVNVEDFGERDDHYHAYAQVQVYNPIANDLYTSRWKSKLVPAKWMDDPQKVADAIRTRRGTGQFDLLARIILSERNSHEWTSVNNH